MNWVTQCLIVLTTVLLTVSTAAMAQECENLKNVQWLKGQWQSKTHNTLMREEWLQTDQDNLMGSSTSTSIDSQKVTFSESMRIIRMENEVFFLAKPVNHNVPTAFKLIECSPDFIRFTNSKHDFPKIIEYFRTNDNQIKATVRGTGSQQFSIEYVRI